MTDIEIGNSPQCCTTGHELGASVRKVLETAKKIQAEREVVEVWPGLKMFQCPYLPEGTAYLIPEGWLHQTDPEMKKVVVMHNLKVE